MFCTDLGINWVSLSNIKILNPLLANSFANSYPIPDAPPVITAQEFSPYLWSKFFSILKNDKKIQKILYAEDKIIVKPIIQGSFIVGST